MSSLKMELDVVVVVEGRWCERVVIWRFTARAAVREARVE